MAMLEDEPIPMRSVPEYHCHDAAWPVITCFHDSGQRDDDMTSAKATLLALVYALVYVDADYGGASMAMAADYPNLGTIGWNNRISSFKSPNGGHPKFWDGTSYAPPSWQWSTGASVPNVGGAANDKFSSIKNVP